jgi:serine/threonine protein kinase
MNTLILPWVLKCLFLIPSNTSIFWCLTGLTYHGKAADVWALGCTLYCMVLGSYPFKGDNLQSTYDKVHHHRVRVSTSHDSHLLFLLGESHPSAWDITFTRGAQFPKTPRIQITGTI